MHLSFIKKQKNKDVRDGAFKVFINVLEKTKETQWTNAQILEEGLNQLLHTAWQKILDRNQLSNSTKRILNQFKYIHKLLKTGSIDVENNDLLFTKNMYIKKLLQNEEELLTSTTDNPFGCYLPKESELWGVTKEWLSKDNLPVDLTKDLQPNKKKKKKTKVATQNLEINQIATNNLVQQQEKQKNESDIEEDLSKVQLHNNITVIKLDKEITINKMEPHFIHDGISYNLSGLQAGKKISECLEGVLFNQKQAIEYKDVIDLYEWFDCEITSNGGSHRSIKFEDGKSKFYAKFFELHGRIDTVHGQRNLSKMIY